MSKTTRTYWNPLSDEHRDRWQPIEGLGGMAEELTLAIEEASGDYTRLTRFAPGNDPTLLLGRHPIIKVQHRERTLLN